MVGTAVLRAHAPHRPRQLALPRCCAPLRRPLHATPCMRPSRRMHVLRTTRRGHAAAACAATPAAACAATPAAACAATPAAAPADAAPRLRDLVAFALPSMGIWFASPLLSIVDVGVVGMGSTTELASLAPATGLCDSAAYMCSFLSVATMSLVARARARSDVAAAQRSLADALAVAGACGMALGTVLLLFASPILAAYAGRGADAALLSSAVGYTRIRALGMPFALVLSVAQAAFLAAKAPSLPLLATAAASLVNLGGDLLLCCLWHQGAAGAAWATVASQAVAAVVVASQLRKPPAPGQTPLLAPTTTISLLPRRAACIRMLRLGGPVCMLIAIKIFLIAGGITGAASRLSPTACAVHAVMMTLLIFGGTFGDAVSQAAQSFLPALLGRPDAAFAFCRMLLASATCIGAVNAAAAGLLPVLAPGLFTSSADVAAGMAQLAPVMSAALVLHCASMATEGLLLAGRDMTWLLSSYSRNAAACFVTLFAVQRAGLGLPAVWCCFLQFHVTRLAQNGHRLFASPASPLRSTAPLPRDDAGDA